MSTMPKERKILLAVFFVLLGVSAIVVAGNIYMPELHRLDRQIEENNKKIEDLSQAVYRQDTLDNQITMLSTLIDNKRMRFYKEGETTLFRFADSIKHLIQKNGLKISNFQMANVKNESLPDFSIKGRTSDFIKFIDALYKQKNSVRVPFMRINAEKDGSCLANIRIGYEEY